MTNRRRAHEDADASVSPKTKRLLKLYEDDLHLRMGERTVPGYLAHVRVFLGWITRRQLELVSVRTDDLLTYQTSLLSDRKRDGAPYSVAYQSARLIAVKSLFSFLYRRGYLLSDPAAAVDLPRQDRQLPRTIMSPEEVKRILAAVKGTSPRVLRDRAILETFYATGLRVSELANLTPYDVDLEDRVLRIVLGKGRKDRNVPLTRVAVLAIEAYLARGRKTLLRRAKTPWLFVADKSGRMNRVVIARIVQHWATKAGVKKHITPHTFRHSVATHLLKGRADIRHIQALLGHASLTATQRYTRVEIGDLKEVITRAHPRGR